MGANDEFDNGNDAPVPPHERTWRHPAEVSNAMRQEQALKAAPPPIGRRAAALVAFVSIVASATLMVVTVQKGVSEPVAEPVDAPTTSLPSKTGTANGAVPVVHAYDDYYVVPSDEFAGNRLTAALPGGKRFDAEVVTTIPAKGISIVRHRAPTLRNLPYPSGPEIVTHLSTAFTAVDRMGQRLTATVGLSSHSSPVAVASQWNVGWFPLDIDGVINGVASLYVGEQLHGIAVRHQHTHFGISLDGLADLINDANGARNG